MANSFARFLLIFVALIFIAVDYTEGQSDASNPEISEPKEYVARYHCPLVDGPEEQTECCDPAEYKCCRERKFYEIDRMAGIIIAVSVVLCCILITITVITCCIWEKCPLYMACRAEAKPDYIAHPDEAMALATTMPNENVKNVRVYVPKEAASRPGNFV